MPQRPLVVVTRKLPEPVEARMRKLFDARLNEKDVPLTRQKLVAAVGMADVLVPTVTDRIDASLLAAAGPRLKLIANFGVGIDHIDLAAAETRGIVVTNTPGVLTEDTADMTMALILAAARRLAEGERLVRGGKWKTWAPTFMLGARLGGKRLGIIGMGRIGQAVAQRARGFGMEIHYHNRRRIAAGLERTLEATYWRSLDRMLPRIDILSVNCPYTPDTHHLLSARRLKLLPAHAIVVNTARGGIIDEAALAQMLAKGEVAAAGLDVFEREPAVDQRLKRLDNVVLTPHMGSGTREGRIDMGEKVIANIKSFTDGRRPPDRVAGT
ncbi:MAG TPA: D-glycerate dehydrogenase [Stellaceae bacterium]|nr:D-glycerate dehydrogenase [Stellaceae bacterium]